MCIRDSLIEAVGAATVSAEEREQPAHALVGVDLLDQLDVVTREVELFGEYTLDHEHRHVGDATPSLNYRPGLADRRTRPPRCGSRTRSCEECCARGSRRCAR